jgi:hypothetical protein
MNRYALPLLVENRRAFLAKDFGAIMALRTEDFHAVTPDGVLHDRAQMEQATRASLQGSQPFGVGHSS